MTKIKDLEINEEKEYTKGNIHLSVLPKNNVHIMTSKYGEVTSAQLNKTQIKRIINWLNKWVESLEVKSK